MSTILAQASEAGCSVAAWGVGQKVNDRKKLATPFFTHMHLLLNIFSPLAFKQKKEKLSCYPDKKWQRWKYQEKANAKKKSARKIFTWLVQRQCNLVLLFVKAWPCISSSVTRSQPQALTQGRTPEVLCQKVVESSNLVVNAEMFVLDRIPPTNPSNHLPWVRFMIQKAKRSLGSGNPDLTLHPNHPDVSPGKPLNPASGADRNIVVGICC